MLQGIGVKYRINVIFIGLGRFIFLVVFIFFDLYFYIQIEKIVFEDFLNILFRVIEGDLLITIYLNLVVYMNC